MKRGWMVALVAVAMLALVGTAQADTIKLNVVNNYFNPGGPFNATVYPTIPTGLLGTPVGNNIEFLTFCLEYSETFNPNTVYNFTISDKAINGGGGPHPDPLDARTAYLYYNFRMNPGAYDNPHMKALQLAIWHIEQEQDLPALYTTNSVQDFAWQYVNNSGSWSDIGPVVVLNLFDANGVQKQSQLGLMASVPEPGTLLLLGSGLIGTAVMVRRRIG